MGIFVTGKVWKFGDNINTDYMAPSFSENDPWEVRKKHILHIHPVFAEQFKPGDVIVAGKNFGCGSSREEAPENLKRLGVGCVAAESFGRIFFRNCIGIALPILVCKGVSELFDEGDHLEMRFETSLVRNLTKGKEVTGQPLSSNLINIVKMGGILALLKSESPAAH